MVALLSASCFQHGRFGHRRFSPVNSELVGATDIRRHRFRHTLSRTTSRSVQSEHLTEKASQAGSPGKPVIKLTCVAEHGRHCHVVRFTRSNSSSSTRCRVQFFQEEGNDPSGKRDQHSSSYSSRAISVFEIGRSNVLRQRRQKGRSSLFVVVFTDSSRFGSWSRSDRRGRQCVSVPRSDHESSRMGDKSLELRGRTVETR